MNETSIQINETFYRWFNFALARIENKLHVEICTYRIVASRSSCYYSENQNFCFLKSRILTCRKIFLWAKLFFVFEARKLKFEASYWSGTLWILAKFQLIRTTFIFWHSMFLIELNSISNMGRQKYKLSNLLDIPATWQTVTGNPNTSCVCQVAGISKRSNCRQKSFFPPKKIEACYYSRL